MPSLAHCCPYPFVPIMLCYPQIVDALVSIVLAEIQLDLGAILVFADDRNLILKLRELLSRQTSWHLSSLFSDCSEKDMEMAFNARQPRRVIISTDIADCGLTVPGVSIVLNLTFNFSINTNQCRIFAHTTNIYHFT